VSLTQDDLVSVDALQTKLLEPGAYTVPPPISKLPSIVASIATACEAVPKDKSGAFVAQVDETGVRGVIVERVNDDFAIIGWVGKDWDKTAFSYGAAVQLTW
jgi:hydroxymethylglutaryl-CoA reductase